MYLKKQKTEAIYCVIFQTYCLTKDQIMGQLFRNLVSLSTAFHLEYCNQLERDRENDQQSLTLSRVMHILCNTFLNTMQMLYKHYQFLYRHSFSEVCVNNPNKRGFSASNFVFNRAGYG